MSESINQRLYKMKLTLPRLVSKWLVTAAVTNRHSTTIKFTGSYKEKLVYKLNCTERLMNLPD